MIDNPIFIIGTERSGSNLLRLILNSHSNICIPHPPHLMRDFREIEKMYGDLNDHKNFNQLLNDCVSFVNAHFAPWPYKVEANELKEYVRVNSLYGVYVAIYDQYLAFKNKKRWGCKSTFMWNEIEKIVQFHKNPRFIHLVRDPRDVAVSARKSIFSKGHPFNQAVLWQKEQFEIEKRRGYFLNSKNYLLIKYEDLTRYPELTMEKIMNFLDEKIEEQQFNFFNTAEASQLAEQSKSWKNVQKPIDAKSVGQFEKNLSEREIEMVEIVCGDLMKQYGYNLQNSSNIREVSTMESYKIEMEEFYFFIKNEIVALFGDKNFLKRWQKKILLKNIVSKQLN